MAEFYPFRALRPAPGKAEQVACYPYDVLSDADARALSSNPDSFVHVIRSEADMPSDTNPYAKEVYDKAAASFSSMKEKGTLIKEENPAFYLYREISHDHVQTGFVGCVLSSEYEAGRIRRHELTVAEKEDDRTNHILALRAQTGPVFLTFRADDAIRSLADDVARRTPVYDFTHDSVRHQVWMIDDAKECTRLQELFRHVPLLYIADGHHRAASSRRVSVQLNADDSQEAGRFMAVAFPSDDLLLLGYHRFVEDLCGMAPSEYLEQVAAAFDFTLLPDEDPMPKQPHEIIMTLGRKNYLLVPHEDIYDPHDSISRLDVSILQNHLLSPILGIEDPRRDHRISFHGGAEAASRIRALSAENEEGVGFILYPTAIDDLLAVADDERIMPPKSTWFEPKLLSGLFVHEI